jgi:GNAT superfamily N-acetyltransferase
MFSRKLKIVSIADRPDLIPLVGEWLWDAFWRAEGADLAETVAAITQSAIGAAGIPRTLVLLQNGVPAGTASLMADDLAERPDLTPWLAGVYVPPAQRGRGHATRLIAAVEQAARTAKIPALWLYTATAEPLYQRLGWQVAGSLRHAGSPVTLMRKAL